MIEWDIYHSDQGHINAVRNDYYPVMDMDLVATIIMYKDDPVFLNEMIRLFYECSNNSIIFENDYTI